MTRRSMLGLMAAFVADPERLLWVPGKKLISIPKVSQLDLITEATLRYLGETSNFAEYFFREDPLLKALKKMDAQIDGGHGIKPCILQQSSNATWTG